MADVDVIADVLKKAMEAYPDNNFLKSLWQQYGMRGSLSKKQLEGLFSKASKISSLPPGRLATLEAIILKKPTRYRSTISLPEKALPDTGVGEKIECILEKYPAHKRVLFFKFKSEKGEKFNSNELDELDRFHKLLIK